MQLIMKAVLGQIVLNMSKRLMGDSTNFKYIPLLCETNGKELLKIDSNGRIFVDSKEVETSDDFKKMMIVCFPKGTEWDWQQ